MAVYTDVSDEALGEFLQGFDLGELVFCKGIAEGIENSNFIVQTTRDLFILTLYEKRINEAELPFFLNLMVHLNSNGVTCPVPVANKAGETLGTLCGRKAAFFTFLKGSWPRTIRPVHCSELGGALAAMHVASAGFPMSRPNTLSLTGWRELESQCHDHADTVMPGLGQIIQVELDHLETYWPKGLPSGVIHADLFPDNVFFQQDRLSGLIDFYFACVDLFAYDLAICMNAWCFERDGDFNVTKARKLLASYRKVRAFTDAEVDALPLLARGAALRFLLTRLYDWVNTPEGALVKPKNPLEYLHILKFHQGVRHASAYGLG